MKYKNAKDVLPPALIRQLQRYVSGEMIYVPKNRSRASWGENSGAREYFARRNCAMRERFLLGEPLEDIAAEQGLSIDTVRKIVYHKDQVD